MNINDLRHAFLNFFAQKQHQVIESASLIPDNDPTLLFTNAGMVPFKDVFLGKDKRAYVRAASCQLCVRAGGKHNDLENVGYTARHHTLFEMLGNFSFGDYFKREAIQYAWEFVTKILKFPPEKLWVTVYESDKEAEAIWLEEMKVSPERFSRCGKKDNFWSMGDVGPCGPCSEIFYDHGESVPGGPPGSLDEEGDRFVEIWNLVFMQYNRDQSGQLTPLPQPSVDTGMGLERVAAILQNVHNNYDIDIFKHLIKDIATLLKCNNLGSQSLKVIADHLRACSFLVADGVVPSNEGRGYVLRRIMRRAIRHGRKLGQEEPFFHQLVHALVQEMGQAYPHLEAAKAKIEKVFLQEEIQFGKTIEQGLKLLQEALAKLDSKILMGETIFKLYDTYGFPVDLTADIAREQGVTLDMHGFEEAMLSQRQRARKASQFGMAASDIQVDETTEFLGYHSLSSQEKIVKIFQDNKEVKALTSGAGVIVLEKTPFYGESGGQVGDTGVLETKAGAFFKVTDTQKNGASILHIGELMSGSFQLGDIVFAKVDKQRREAIKRNHSATHLMHAALCQYLGEHVQQKGSVVDEKKLRFDFSHFEPLTWEQIQQIEDSVNQQILNNSAVKTEEMDVDAAKAKGAMALFDEKYNQQVRVLTMGDGYSVELCGGTHVTRTGDIGLFKIVAETGVAAGIRRIEALTGENALTFTRHCFESLEQLGQLLKSDPLQVGDKVRQNVEKIKILEKRIHQLEQALAKGEATQTTPIQEIEGVKLVVSILASGNPKILRESVDNYKNQLKDAVIVLAGVDDDKVNLVVGVTKNITDKVHAGELVNYIAKQLGGGGGGRPDMAMAGGNDLAKLEQAMQTVYAWVKEKLV